MWTLWSMLLISGILHACNKGICQTVIVFNPNVWWVISGTFSMCKILKKVKEHSSSFRGMRRPVWGGDKYIETGMSKGTQSCK